MFRVNTFLGTISLELFALFIGWFFMITTMILAIVVVVAIVFFIIHQGEFSSSFFTIRIYSENISEGPVIVACIAAFVLSFLMCYVSKQLIRGVENVSRKSYPNKIS